ncbi:MAG: heparinase II/III family protein, partial [Armatimonadota bacterium]
MICRYAIVTAAILLAFTASISSAAENIVFEDFDTVESWEGFELSTEQTKSGETSALWADMVGTTTVESSEIPHDWSDYSAFTFWVYNVREVPTAFMCIIRSENPATEGMDYWSVKVSLNFTGWKRFGILLREGGGARTPRGWDEVDSISFRSSGWNNEPSPDATVYIDRLELRRDIGGRGPLIDDEEFFGLLDNDIEALAPVREAAAEGDYDRADELLLEYMRARQEPKFSFDCSEWDKSRDPDFNTARADAVMEHIFSFQGREADLPDDIDWTYNPFDKDDPAYTPEWTYGLNRFSFWRDLGRAYWATGDEKYAQEFVDQMTDWVHDQPAPVLGSPNSAPTWRTIEQGIRTAGSWQDAYCYFLHSPSLTPE